MRAILVLAIVLVAMVSFSSIAVAAETEPSIIPKWRVAVKALPYYYSSLPMLGVYYRVGNRYDFGVSVDGGAEFSSSARSQERIDEGEYSMEGKNTDVESFDITVYTDLRRWSRVNDRASWYLGGRAGAGYRFNEDEDLWTDTDSWRKTRYRLLGLWFVAGADIRLLDHLTVSASFAPLGIKHTWNKYTSEYDRDETDEPEFRSRTVEERNAFSIDANMEAVAYLSVTF